MKSPLEEFKQLFTKKGDAPIDAARDWHLVVVGAVVLLLVSAGWNALLFGQVVRGELIGSEVAPIGVGTESPLEEVRAILEERARVEIEYREGSVVVDPSL